MTPADEDKLKKLENTHFIEQSLDCFYASASVTQASTLDFNQNNTWSGERETLLTLVLLLMLSGTLRKKLGAQHAWLKRLDQEFDKHLKGFRDVNRVTSLINSTTQHKNLSLRSGLLVIGFGLIYTRLIVHNENTRKTQKDNIRDNQRSASHLLQQLTLQTQSTHEEIKIKQVADATTQRKRLVLNGAEGFFLGNYFAASWLQIVQFLACIVPKINPNPVYFAITGAVLGLGFMAQKICDQKCLDLQEELGVLHCEVGKDLLQFRQTTQQIAQVEQQLATPENKHTDTNTTELKTSLAGLIQRREQLQTALLSKKNLLVSKQQQLHSWTRYSSNVTQVTNTITRIVKNDIVAITAMLAGPGVKLLLGASFLSACGGPIGLALLGAGLACLLAYALYKQYQKHKLKQVHHQKTQERGMALYGLIKSPLALSPSPTDIDVQKDFIAKENVIVKQNPQLVVHELVNTNDVDQQMVYI